MSKPFDWINDELTAWKDLGLLRERSERETFQGVEIVLDGKELINFGSNDYLGLAGRSLSTAVGDAVEAMGWGSGASPLVSGRGSFHVELESMLADFQQTESAILFPSGFAANLGTISTLAGKGDVILSDAKNHASIIDGCRLSGARIVVYPHRDVEYVDMMLRQAGTFRRRLIVTDSLFSMDGDLAPLVELSDLAERHDAMLVVDEAHATGVFGENGRGIVEHLGIEDRVPVRVGTLSKALGSIGGFVVGPQYVVDWLSNRARPYVFSTAPPDAAAAAACHALDMVRYEPERRVSLLQKADALRQRLRGAGLNVGQSQSQIIPVIVGASEETMRIASALRQQGFFVPGIRPPSVPDGESLLRISVTSDHTDEMLDVLFEALQQCVRVRA